MFSNDHNVDIIARLISNLKKYGELRLKSFQLDLVRKLTLVLTFLVVAVLLVGVASIVVLLLSFALVYALAPIVGGIVVSCGIVAGGFILLGILLVAFRKRLLINPIARFLSSIFLSVSWEEGNLDDSSNSNTTPKFY